MISVFFEHSQTVRVSRRAHCGYVTLMTTCRMCRRPRFIKGLRSVQLLAGSNTCHCGAKNTKHAILQRERGCSGLGYRRFPRCWVEVPAASAVGRAAPARSLPPGRKRAAVGNNLLPSHLHSLIQRGRT